MTESAAAFRALHHGRPPGELGAARVTFGPPLQRRAAAAVRGPADRLNGR
ncbi:hypothetical protein [Streptomyces sp. NBC_00178]